MTVPAPAALGDDETGNDKGILVQVMRFRPDVERITLKLCLDAIVVRMLGGERLPLIDAAVGGSLLKTCEQQSHWWCGEHPSQSAVSCNQVC